ncbi:uncharacterized protein LOC116349062 [Contarinia nasturtii]|uniref:uncharacterized protein LOC116349062 n=1 Tax=Contarinia nasturtii TaxID=265458 RepID=UPI0012D394DD|nr:uncharacterized protein LOC116349062 [Contarinia nasturtii]
MKWSEVFCCILICFVLSPIQFGAVNGLIWSQYTLMQVVCCVSWPIPYKNPLRKLFFNVGFQFNYNEPFALSNFYNATYYQNIFNSRDFKGSPSTTNNDTDNRMQSRSIDGSSNLVGKDLTAAEFYESIEDNFVEIGYDRSCLKKAICELARHPLHKEDDEEHLLMDVINFVLTPSNHNGFAEHEKHERQKYETAQKIGENGHDCDVIYSECENSILNNFSHLLIE